MLSNFDEYRDHVKRLTFYYQPYEFIDREKVIKELNLFLLGPHTNGNTFEKIDYEKLIWWEFELKDDAEVIELINQLKETIANFYLEKLKIINRATNRVNKDELESSLKEGDLNLSNSRLKEYFVRNQQGDYIPNSVSDAEVNQYRKDRKWNCKGED